MSARTRNLSPWAYWMLRLEAARLSDPLPTRDPGEIPAWRDRCAARVEEALGPGLERVPLDLEVRDSTDAGSYTRASVVFDSEPAMSVPAFLLVPHARRERGPAVLAVHGHGPGKREICGLPEDDTREDDARGDDADGPPGDYAHHLAEMGYVVLAPDLRCFGERLDWAPPDKYPCDLNLVHAYAAGVNPLAQNLWDLARCLDVLEQHELVDAARLGVVGFSYGGTLALFLAAHDARVRAAVVSGYVSMWQEAHRMPWNLCGSQVLPAMLTELDHVALGALVAPRALLVETGDDDPIFPVAGAREIVAALGSVYEALGEPHALEHHVFAGGHRWDGATADGFLARHLGATA